MKNKYINAIGLLLGLTISFPVHAQGASGLNSGAKLVGIKVQNKSSGTIIDLEMDKAYSAQGLKDVNDRNFIQIVLKNTKIDSAKIIPTSQVTTAGALAKVFAYAFTPDTTRVRLIFNSVIAPQTKNKIYNLNSKTIRLEISVNGLALNTSVRSADKSSEKSSQKTYANSPQQAKDDALLAEVKANTKEIDLYNPDSIKKALNNERSKDELNSLVKISAVEKSGTGNNNTNSLNAGSAFSQNSATPAGNNIGVKNEPSKPFFKMLGALTAVLLLFLGLVFGLRKYAGKLNNLPFGKKERIIQIVATHVMGKQKSISLIKVADEYMVVGVGNEGFTLLTKLGSDANVGKYIDERFWNGTFEKHLKSFEKDKASLDSGDENEEASYSAQSNRSQKSGVIASIKNKIAASLKAKVRAKNTATDYADTGSVGFAHNLASQTSFLDQYDNHSDAATESVIGMNQEQQTSGNINYGLSHAAGQVADRVEISGARSNLREKLTKLKPLG